MRVVLINPSFNRYGGLKGHGGSLLPINLCYLASYGRQQHPDVELKVIDADVRGLSHEETIDETEAFSPSLVGISANTCAFDSVLDLVGFLKARLSKVRVIIGGSHPSALPKDTLMEPGVDFIAVGEGEYIFSELLDHLKNGDEDWSKINGLGYHDGEGRARINLSQPLIQNLDTLPFPARDLLDNSVYQPAPTKRVHGGTCTPIVSSRGCPFKCGFCSAPTIWTRVYRHRSPENVVAEIEECIDKYGIHAFSMTDELFTARKKRVLRLCNLMIERKLDISWVCTARAQKLDMEILEAMREAGCKEMSLGIESGNEAILSKIDKSLKLSEAEQVIKMVKKARIKTHASYIIGYLDETEETIKDTIRFSHKLNTDIAAFFIASPLPGTPFYNEAKKKGYLRKNISWVNFSPLSNAESVISFPSLTTETIREWHRKAIKSYYLRPRYILRRLFSIRHWYEVENLFLGMKVFLNIKK